MKWRFNHVLYVVIVITKQQVKEKRKCDSKSVIKTVASENGGCRREVHLARISTPTDFERTQFFPVP